MIELERFMSDYFVILLYQQFLIWLEEKLKEFWFFWCSLRLVILAFIWSILINKTNYYSVANYQKSGPMTALIQTLLPQKFQFY